MSYAARFTSRAAEIEIDRTVLGITLIATVVSGLLFGGMPALVGSGAEGTRGSRLPTSSRRARRVQRSLAVVQVAVAFSVLGGAALVLNSVWTLSRVDPGLDTENVISFRALAVGPEYQGDPEAQYELIEEVMARFRDVPDVQGAARAVAWDKRASRPVRKCCSTRSWGSHQP